MEASRNEAADRFLSRLREQLAPLLEDAQVTLQDLTASEKKLRDKSQAIRERFDNFLQQTTQNSIAKVQEKTLGMLEQFESDVTKRVAESHDRLNERSVEVIGEITRIMQKFSQGWEETVQGQLRSLVSSAAADVTKLLKERTSDIVR
jgi:dihydroneopterin aldolase